MKLISKLFILIIVTSCQIQDLDKINNIVKEKKIFKNETIILDDKKNNSLKYIVGDSYFINGVEYTPKENYNYNEIVLAGYYNKELHNVKTINNDYNKVTELLARHKTLPIPSVVKITNLDNGLSLTLKVIDRHNNNSTIIEVSRKSAQLLKFYRNKIAKVRVEILPDPSKQMKIVMQSINESSFNETIISAPTENVLITDIKDNLLDNSYSHQETPIELGFSEVADKKMFLKIYDFKSYNMAKSVFNELKIKNNFTTQKENSSYSLIIGPLDSIKANNLVLSFISRGYKKTEFFLE